jgi:U3 small nucleolar RNA-associated protein 19
MAFRHLPEYLVAAFAKKMSRLSLHAPAPAIPMICDFITNLMLEHPGLKTLVNKNSKASKPGVMKQDEKSGEWTIEEDPFNFNEPDPIRSRAMDSSLWEIKTLQSHVLPSVALAAKFISKALPKVEKDLDDTLSLTYDDVRFHILNIDLHLAVPKVIVNRK